MHLRSSAALLVLCLAASLAPDVQAQADSTASADSLTSVSADSLTSVPDSAAASADSAMGRASGTMTPMADSADVQATTSANRADVRATAPTDVRYYGSPESSIAAAVAIPAGRALYWTSGTVPPVLDEGSPSGTRERYGDTETQATGVLERIRDRLGEEGLGLEDVVYLRVYLVADPEKDGLIDYRGWFNAYAKFFGTEENPTKPARSTVGVAGLVSPDWLVEIEAFAAYPE